MAEIRNNYPIFIFVYGTLKTEQPNNFFLHEKENGFSKLISKGKTIDKFPLIVASRYTLPFLLHSSKSNSQVGNHVNGEVYEIDDKMRESLDDFEDYPEVYNRSLKQIELDASTLNKDTLRYIQQYTVSKQMQNCDKLQESSRETIVKGHSNDRVKIENINDDPQNKTEETSIKSKNSIAISVNTNDDNISLANKDLKPAFHKDDQIKPTYDHLYPTKSNTHSPVNPDSKSPNPIYSFTHSPENHNTATSNLSNHNKYILECWVYHIENYPEEVLHVKPMLENYDAYAQTRLYVTEEDAVGQEPVSIYQELLDECQNQVAGHRKLSGAGGTMSPGKVTQELESVLASKDQTQVNLLKEQCILIDNDDNNIGAASKKDCHLLANIDKGLLHRAFSVFLFNTKGELLLQKRSDQKITFPNHWTNTCCSHPLNTSAELEENSAMGVKRASQRKLHHELGIETSQVPLEDFHYLTRIHYRSPNVPDDGIFGEHEIDYILFIQRNVDIDSNTNEVSAYKYVDRKALQQIMEQASSGEVLITPWFRLIVEGYLSRWWDNLHALETVKQPGVIHRAS